MVSSDTAIVNGIVTLMVKFKWSRITVVSQQETIFTSVSGYQCEHSKYIWLRKKAFSNLHILFHLLSQLQSSFKLNALKCYF